MKIDTELALRLVDTHYDIRASAKILPGMVDYNFYLRSEQGQEFTIKINRKEEDEKSLDFLARLLQHLQKTNFPLDIPEVIPSTNGKNYIEIKQGHYLRLHKWVEGRDLAEALPRTPEMLVNWGATCATINLYLHDFDSKYASDDNPWDPSETLKSKKYRHYITDQKKLKIVDYFWDLFESDAIPLLPTLRKGINHNDLHEYNLLTNLNSNNKITGIIDFGDAHYTYIINELAIACSYAAMGMTKPLAAFSLVVKGYHEVYKLQENELKVLFPLIGARLTLSVAIAAWIRQTESNTEFYVQSEETAWALLAEIKQLSPDVAYNSFRKACDY